MNLRYFGKEKKEGTRAVGGPGRATAHFRSSIMTWFLQPCVATGLLVSQPGPRPRVRHDLDAHNGTCARQSLLALCHDTVFSCCDWVPRHVGCLGKSLL